MSAPAIARPPQNAGGPPTQIGAERVPLCPFLESATQTNALLARSGSAADRQAAQPLAVAAKMLFVTAGLDHGRAGLADAAPFLAGCGGDVEPRSWRVLEAHDR
jgi:hypothetical protein